MEEIKQIIHIFYQRGLPNTKILFLPPPEYIKKCRKLGRELEGIVQNYENTHATTFYDRKTKTFFIIFNDVGYHAEYSSAYQYIMIHELCHVETFPVITKQHIQKTGKKQEAAMNGYSFWKEYIAEKKCIDFWQEYYGKFPPYIEANNYIMERQEDPEAFYEIAACCEKTGVYPSSSTECWKKLLSLLNNIEKENSNNLQTVSVKEMIKIGNILNNML